MIKWSWTVSPQEGDYRARKLPYPKTCLSRSAYVSPGIAPTVGRDCSDTRLSGLRTFIESPYISFLGRLMICSQIASPFIMP